MEGNETYSQYEYMSYLAQHLYGIVGYGRATCTLTTGTLNDIWKFSEKAYMILEDTKNLSDEDALAVAKLFAVNSLPEKLLISFGRECVDCIVRDIPSGTISLTPRQSGIVCDFLRTAGYAIPWGKYSVEQLIEKEWLEFIKDESNGN